jgi:hypothetical protein
VARRRLIVGGVLGSLVAIIVSRVRAVRELPAQVSDLARAGRTRIGGSRGREALAERPKEELYEQAKERDIPGRSTMTKDELIDALEDESA